MEQEAGKSGRFVDASEQVIGACIEVHRHLGPGLLESAYHECLRYELRLRGLKYVSEIQVPVAYKGISLDCGYRLDFLIEDSIILEIKAVETPPACSSSAGGDVSEAHRSEHGAARKLQRGLDKARS